MAIVSHTSTLPLILLAAVLATVGFGCVAEEAAPIETGEGDAAGGREIVQDEDAGSSSELDGAGGSDSADAVDEGSSEATLDAGASDVVLGDAEPTDVAFGSDGSGSPDAALPDAGSPDVSPADSGTGSGPDVSADVSPDTSPDVSPDTSDGMSGTCARPVVASVGSTSATPSVDEQSPSCLSIDESEAVFAFTPPASGTYCLDTRGSEAADTLVSVRMTCDDVATELVCYDDITEPRVLFQAFGTFTASSTAQVFVLVDTYDYSTGDSVTLTISEGACPSVVVDPGGGDEPDLGEASCVDSVDDVADDSVPGDTFLISCPSVCAGRDYVYGTDIYTDDSWICSAAIHAGAITDDGGQVRVTVAAGQANYVGSTRNGVTSLGWSTGWSRSYTVEAP